MSLCYCVVTPAKDEEERIGLTIESMVSQTLKPLQWVVVDDGSKDRTAEIVKAVAEKHDWISLVNTGVDRGRLPGKGIIEAFYRGYEMISELEFDIIVKLDADLSFDPEFFAGIIREFENDSKLGICGGTIYVRTDDKEYRQRVSPYHVRGCTKCYRRKCFDQIGGLHRSLGWDAMDDFKAEMLGWRIESFEHLQVISHRASGENYGSLKHWWIAGKICYLVGYHPLYVIARGIYRFIDRPYILGGLALVTSYVYHAIRRPPRPDEPEMRKYVRKQQMARLFPWGRSKV